MKTLLKRHHRKMLQKRIIKKILIIIFITLFLVTGFNFLQIGFIKYGDFIKQVWDTQMLLNNCNDMEKFISEYPNSTLNKKEIEQCRILGLLEA